MNPYLAEGLVRSHQQDLLAAAQQHRRLAAVRRAEARRFAHRRPSLFRPAPAPCCS